MSNRYLVDTSVLARAVQREIGDRLEHLALHGNLWTCRMVDLELGFASRANAVPKALHARRLLPEAPITPAVMDRSLEVMELLAGAGQHRGAKPADLIIAAAAELSGLTVLHYDDDYDRIAAATGQQCEWITTRGSID
jgi:predicted nucleic acid-binding protein